MFYVIPRLLQLPDKCVFNLSKKCVRYLTSIESVLYCILILQAMQTLLISDAKCMLSFGDESTSRSIEYACMILHPMPGHVNVLHYIKKSLWNGFALCFASMFSGTVYGDDKTASVNQLWNSPNINWLIFCWEPLNITTTLSQSGFKVRKIPWVHVLL